MDFQLVVAWVQYRSLHTLDAARRTPVTPKFLSHTHFCVRKPVNIVLGKELKVQKETGGRRRDGDQFYPNGTTERTTMY